MKKLSVSLFVMSILFTSSCKKNVVVCDGSTPTYDANIKVIIDNNCVRCHSGYDNYAQVMTWVSSGKFESEVISKQTMPEKGKLTDTQLSAIKCWLETSTPEN